VRGPSGAELKDDTARVVKAAEGFGKGLSLKPSAFIISALTLLGGAYSVDSPFSPEVHERATEILQGLVMELRTRLDVRVMGSVEFDKIKDNTIIHGVDDDITRPGRGRDVPKGEQDDGEINSRAA